MLRENNPAISNGIKVRLYILIACLLFLLLPLDNAYSQAPTPLVQNGYPSQARGVEPDTLYTSDGIENINVFNGNLSLSIPIGPSYPLNGGQSYNLKLSYNANPWEAIPVHGTNCTGQLPGLRPDSMYNAGLGWQMSFGRLLEPQNPGPNPSPQYEHSGNTGYWVFESGDGGRYQILGDALPFSTTTSPTIAYDDQHELVGADGSMRMIKHDNNPRRIDIEFSNGSIHEFENIGSPNGEGLPYWRATKIYFGHESLDNYIEIDYGVSNLFWRIKDSIGRVHKVNFEAADTDNNIRYDDHKFGQIDTIELAGFQGNDLTYDLQWVKSTIDMHNGKTVLAGGLGCSLEHKLQSTERVTRYPVDWYFDVPLLKRIVMPDDMFYQFYYHLADTALDTTSNSFLYTKSGAIKQIRYPTGWRTDYTYTSGVGGDTFQFTSNPTTSPYSSANAISGVSVKHAFEVDEEGVSDAGWEGITDGADIPSSGVVTTQYVPGIAQYISSADTQPNPDGQITLKPCYLTRQTIDPIGRKITTFYNNVGVNSYLKGQPFTMCDPFLEHADGVDLGTDNYFGPRAGLNQELPNQDVYFRHGYELNGSGPFLSKIIQDENGTVLRSEWIRVDTVLGRAAPYDSHTITSINQTRHHKDSGCDDISYDCFPVVAKKTASKLHYDGFGNFGRIDRTAKRFINGEWKNWGSGDLNNLSYTQSESFEYELSDPNQLFIEFDYNFATCKDAYRHGSCAEVKQVGANNQLIIDDSDSWWFRNTIIKRHANANVGAPQSDQSVTHFCYDLDTGLKIGERSLVGTALGEHDNYVVNEYQQNGNLFSLVTLGGDQAELDKGIICPAFTTNQDKNFVTRQQFFYDDGMPSYSEALTCAGDVISQSPVNYYDKNTGWLERTTDLSNKVIIVYGYDSMGRLTHSQVGGKAKVKHDYVFPKWSGGFVPGSLSYTQSTLATCDGNQNGCVPNEILSSVTSQFDARGLVTASHKLQFDGSTAYQYNHHDILGRKTLQSVWEEAEINNPDNRQNLTGYTAYLYDGLDRMIATRLPDNSTQITEYSENGDWEVKTTGLKQLGGFMQGEHFVTHTTQLDAWGQVIQSDEAKSAVDDQSAGSIISSYAYDRQGRMTHVCVGDNDLNASSCNGQLRRFGYDGRGYQVSEQHPEIFDGNNKTAIYSYDGGGKFLHRDLPGNQFDTAYRYDQAGRLTQIRKGLNPLLGDLLSEFFWARQNSGTNLAEKRLVRTKQHQSIRLSATDPTLTDVVVTENYAYDEAEGLLSNYSISTSLGSHFSSKINTYDDLARPLSMSYPECSGACNARELTLDYSYQKGFLKTIKDTNNNSFINGLTYHTDDSLAAIEHGHGVTDFYIKDANNWRLEAIESMGISWSPGTIQYDGSGNIKQIGQDQFHYDGLNRLVSGQVTTVNTTQYQQTIKFDDFGNITQLSQGKADNGVAETIDVAVNPLTNRLNGEEIKYDSYGNLTQFRFNEDGQDIDFEYKYDALGRLYQMQELGKDNDKSYLYSAAGERIATLHLNDNRIDWTPRSISNQVQRRFESKLDLTDWQHLKDYIFMGSHQIAALESDGIIKHFHLDHLGSTRRISQLISDGIQVVRGNDFYPFGGYVIDADERPDREELQFTGHERDITSTVSKNADLDYMHARYFTPRYGRFFSVDPVLGNIGLSQGWNRYSYVLNDPLRFVDPTGRQALTVLEVMYHVATEDYKSLAGLAGTTAVGSSPRLAFEMSKAAAYLTGEGWLASEAANLKAARNLKPAPIPERLHEISKNIKHYTKQTSKHYANASRFGRAMTNVARANLLIGFGSLTAEVYIDRMKHYDTKMISSMTSDDRFAPGYRSPIEIMKILRESSFEREQFEFQQRVREDYWLWAEDQCQCSLERTEVSEAESN